MAASDWLGRPPCTWTRIRSPAGAALQAAAQADHQEAAPQSVHLDPGDPRAHPARTAAVQAARDPVAAEVEPHLPPRHRSPSRQSRGRRPKTNQRLPALSSSLDPFLLSDSRFIPAARALRRRSGGGASGRGAHSTPAVNAAGRMPAAAHQAGVPPTVAQGPHPRAAAAAAAPVAAARTPTWAAAAGRPNHQPGRPIPGAVALEHRTRPARNRTEVVAASSGRDRAARSRPRGSEETGRSGSRRR